MMKDIIKLKIKFLTWQNKNQNNWPNQIHKHNLTLGFKFLSKNICNAEGAEKQVKGVIK